jgi:transcriptional regulator with XRE-family HTH domain
VYEPDESLVDRLSTAIAERTTQAELARALGISTAAVAQWMGGKGQAGWLRLRDVCRVLGVSADYLLGLSDDPRPRTGAEASSFGADLVIRVRNDQIEEVVVRNLHRKKEGEG